MRNLGTYAALLRGLLSGEQAFAGPFALTVDVTHRCNLRCLGCTRRSPLLAPVVSRNRHEDVSVDMVERLCREVNTMGAHSLILCGEGEPLLHPRLLDLIGIAKRYAFRTVLLTNGTLLNQDLASAFVDSGLDEVRVSFWGSSSREWAANYPGTDPEHIRRVPERLSELTALKKTRRTAVPKVTLHLILNRHNAGGIVEFAVLGLRTKVDAVSFSPLHTVRGPLGELQLDPEDERSVRKRLREVGDELRKAGVAHNVAETIRRYDAGPDVWRSQPCFIPWTHSRVRVDGTVLPCGNCDWPMGNLHQQSLREIWNGPEYRSFRRHALTRALQPKLEKYCDCSYCCFYRDNEKIGRFYRWLTPVRSLMGD